MATTISCQFWRGATSKITYLPTPLAQLYHGGTPAALAGKAGATQDARGGAIPSGVLAQLLVFQHLDPTGTGRGHQNVNTVS